MSEPKYSWQSELIAVLLETDNVQLGHKLDVAYTVFSKRMNELSQDNYSENNDALEEHFALQDALRTLRYLRMSR